MPSSSSSRVKAPIGASSLAISPQSPGSDSPVDSGREDDGEMEKELVDGVRKLTVNLHPYRYHGKSSGLVLIRATKGLKDQHRDIERTGPLIMDKEDANHLCPSPYFRHPVSTSRA